MKIKDYKLFLESKQTKEDIDSICKQYHIENYTINNDGTVDVDGDVHLYKKGLTKLPLKFGRVSGFFTCRYNKINTFEGSPKWIGGDFDCGYNQLITLEGGPKTVIGSYWCNNNQLVNFKGFPEDFEGFSNFYKNPVSKLFDKIPVEKDMKFIYWCNELNAIDDDGNVNEEWMEEVYHKLGLKYNED